MSVHPIVHAVFGHFQNLNLLVLVQDLRSGRAARQGWSSGTLLCPVAHGLPAGQDVRELKALGQGADLAQGCDYAANRLGANGDDVLRFVRNWDEEVIDAVGLLRQLLEMWKERLDDAQTVQEILCGTDPTWPEDESPALPARIMGHEKKNESRPLCLDLILATAGFSKVGV